MNKIRQTAKRVYASVLANPVKAAKITAVALFGCICMVYMCYMCTFTAVTVAYADGERIGVVDSADVFAPVMQASNDASLITYPPAKAPSITFEVKLERNSEALSQKQIYEKVYGIATEGYREMFGLYVDGRFAAANESIDVLSKVVKTVEDTVKAQGEGVSITSSLEIKKIYCTGEYAHGEERILSLLSGGISYTDDTDEVVLDIFLSDDADKSFAPDISASNSSSDISTSVDVQAQTKYITVNEDVPFATVYEETEKYFEGVYVKKSDGKNGSVTVLYEIKYENGTEISRTAIERTMTDAPVDKVVYMGIKEKPKTASTGAFIWPLQKGTYIISSRFGPRDMGSRTYHYGLDMAANKGVTIMAADGGLVIAAYTHNSYGIHVIVQHDDGTKTLYAHMSKCSVSEGDRVYQGQKLGEVGTTGFSTGNHLHFEVIINDRTKVDPEKYLPER
ncbi:MAG: peptidoglycan DD-metalloendopeptidase family protein [Clostridia bacterium]|nr:peptidoglycan DD-metalloendopeptidase family protein [Clostridia bacterium]